MDIVGDLLINHILDYCPNVRAIGGPTLGADPLVCAAVLTSKYSYWSSPLKGFLIRKEPKKHGLFKWIEGPVLEPGTKVVIVEDVITTGGSLLHAIHKAKEVGLDVVHSIVLVDRRIEKSPAETPLTSLFTEEDFA